MADIEKARLRAEELVRKYRLIRPPVDPEEIAKREHVMVLYASFGDSVNDQVSGYSEPNRVIMVNKDQPPERKTYTIAHELGHFMLHPAYIESDGYKLLARRDHQGAKKSPEEEAADAFATELLVPFKILNSYRTVSSPEELAKLFVAPVELVVSQLKRLAT